MHTFQDVISPDKEESSLMVNLARKPTSYVVLSTARVVIKDAEGNHRNCRALLDPGSQSNLITQELVDRLKLKCKKHDEIISGINGSATNVARTAEVTFKSMYTDYKTTNV